MYLILYTEEVKITSTTDTLTEELTISPAHESQIIVVLFLFPWK